MFLVYAIHLFPSFRVHQVQSFDLVLLQQYRKGPLEYINSSLEVDYIQHVVDCFLKVLSLLLFLPRGLAVEKLQEFIAHLLDKISEAKIFNILVVEKSPSKFELIKNPSKSHHKHKSSKYSLKYTTNKSNSIQ